MATAGSVTEVVASFEEAYEREYPRLVKVALLMTGRRALAEEVAQEVLLSGWRKWPEVTEMERPDLWLRRAAVNRCISLHRRAISEAAALARVHAVTPAAREDTLTDPELWAAVRSLPARQRAAVILSVVEQRTAAEIGHVLGCSAETAQTHLRRGRTRLAEVLGEDRNEP